MGCSCSSTAGSAHKKHIGQLAVTEDQESAASAEACCAGGGGRPEKYFLEDENEKDKLVGVVVTVFEGSSYDWMFREVQPVTVPGERVVTYSVECSEVGTLHAHLAAAAEAPEAWRGLVEDIHQVPADSVVFNWECCSGCGDHAFPRPAHARHSSTMPFMGFLLDNGFTVMCSDFSLKSLIHEWSEQHLGPNPFIKLGTFDQQFCLEFAPADLQTEEVPQQLQVVGELCAEQGKAVVSALGGTIVYTLDPKRKRTDRYDVKVLTVVTEHANVEEGRWGDDVKCSIGAGSSEKNGTAGHVALTYNGGGQLITSNGHWIELTRIDTSVEAVMRVAAHNFGESEAADFQQDLLGKCEFERAECTQKWASKMVQQSVATRMKCRTKY